MYLQMLKSLDDSFRSGVRPRTIKAVGASNPANTVDNQEHTRKARTVQRMEKNVSNVRSSITSVQCASPRAHPMAGKAKNSNVNKRNQRIKGTSAVLRVPQKKMLTMRGYHRHNVIFFFWRCFSFCCSGCHFYLVASVLRNVHSTV